MPHPLTAYISNLSRMPTITTTNHRRQRQPFEELCHSAKNKRAKVIRTTTKTNNQVAEQLKDLIEQKVQVLRLNTVTVLEDVGDVFSARRASEGSALQQDITNIVEGRPELELHELYSEVLGIGFTSLSISIEDIMSCCFIFKAAADFVNIVLDRNDDGNRAVKFSVKQAPFYEKFIHPVVQRAWDLVLEKHQQSSESDIGMLVGMKLFRFKDRRLNNDRNPNMKEPLAYESFQGIFNELEGFFHFMEQKGTNHHKPTTYCLNQYLGEKGKKEQPSFKAQPISSIFSLTEISQLRLQYVEREIDAKDYAKKLLKALGGDNVDTEKLLSFKDQPLDFESLLSKLKIESVDTMEEQHTQNLFFNSILSSAFIFVRIIRAMQLKSNSKQLFPLDYVAGVTEIDTLDTTNINPAVELHIQKHPHNNHQNVNVMTFSNYLTEKFSEKSLLEIDDAKFYDYQGGRSFLRVATLKPEDDETANEFQRRHPGVTFGNSNSTIRVFESDASGGMTSTEEQFLKISEVFYELLWEAKQFLIEFALLPTLQRTTVGMVEATEASEAEKQVQTQIHPKTKSPPDTTTTVNIHRNFPDSTVTLLSAGKSYSLHSDTNPFKPENWGPTLPKDAMSIFTHGLIAWPKEQDNQQEAIVANTKVATIMHGMSDTEPCEYLGCFSSTDKCWREAENDREIFLIGTSHGHVQLDGSQGSMCHKVTPTGTFNAMKQNRHLARVVMSHRSLRPTIEHRDAEFTRRDTNLLKNSLQPCSNQKYTNCLSNMLGNGVPVEIPVENATTDSNSAAAAADSTPAPTATVRTKKHQFYFMPNKHRNGIIYPPEEINRKRIIGLPQSFSKEKIVTNAVTASKFASVGITLSFTRKKGNSKRQQIQIGPLAEEDPDGSVYLKKPGTITNPNHLDNVFDIQTNNHHDDVFDGVNTFHFRRPAKNCPGLLENIHTVLKGKGKLVSFLAGGYGGAASLSGLYPPDISLKKTDKYVPTHVVSPGQKVSSTGMMELFQLVEGQVACHVFFNGLYVGPFFVKELHCQSLSPEEIRARKMSMLGWLKKIRTDYEVFSNQIKLGSTDSDAMDRELQTLSSSAVTLLFVPLIPDFLEKWKDCQRLRWDLLGICQDDIVHPKIYVRQDEVNDYFGSSKQYNGWQSVLNFGQNSWLPMLEETKLFEVERVLQEKVKRHDPILDETHNVWNPMEQRVMDIKAREIFDGIQKEIAKVESEEDHLEEQRNSRREYQWNDFYHCLFYASATALYRSRKCASKDEMGIMHPPRMLLSLWGGENDSNAETYENNLQESSLKIFIRRSIHASLFSPDKDPVAALASIATGCFSEDVGGWRDDGIPKSRNGKDFVLDPRNQELLSEIFFKATICTFLQPSALIQIYIQMNSKEDILSGNYCQLVPSPQEDKVKAFIVELQKFKWVNSRCMHPIFADSFSDISTFCTFINLLMEKGFDIFASAAKLEDRGKAVNCVLQRFESDLLLALTPFQGSVVMRSIETCIHDPFGPPHKNIVLGYGSKIGAKCLTSVLKCDAQEVPSYIVERLNGIAKVAKEEKDERILDYISVLGLVYEEKSGCLVQKLGLQKKLDEIDIEHSLCMFATTVSLTLPELNNQRKRHPSIDGPKSFPIFYAPNPKSALAKKYNGPAHDLPILKQLFTHSEEEEEAYKRSVRNKSFVLRKEIFSPDI